MSLRSKSRSASWWRRAITGVGGVGAGAQPVQVAALGQQIGQLVGGVPVVGVGAGPQPVPGRPARPADGQPPGGLPVAGVGAGAQSRRHVAALGQQVGQPIGGSPVAGVGPGAQDLRGPVDVAALGQQVGQPLGGSSSPASARARRICPPLMSPRSASRSASCPAAYSSPASAARRYSGMA